MAPPADPVGAVGQPAHQTRRAAAVRRRGKVGSAPSLPAARRSGAASTSPMPFSSICQARPRHGHARAAPARRGAAACARPPATRPIGSAGHRLQPRQRVHQVEQIGCSSTPRSAPCAWARSVIASASAGMPRHQRLEQVEHRSRSARPSIAATVSAAIVPSSARPARSPGRAATARRAPSRRPRGRSASARPARSRTPSFSAMRGEMARSARPPTRGAGRSAGSATARSPAPCGSRWWRTRISRAAAAPPAFSATR